MLANELWKSIKSTSAGSTAHDHGLAGSERLIRAKDFYESAGKAIYHAKGIDHVTLSTVAYFIHDDFFRLSLRKLPPVRLGGNSCSRKRLIEYLVP